MSAHEKLVYMYTVMHRLLSTSLFLDIFLSFNNLGNFDLVNFAHTCGGPIVRGSCSAEHVRTYLNPARGAWREHGRGRGRIPIWGRYWRAMVKSSILTVSLLPSFQHWEKVLSKFCPSGDFFYIVAELLDF